jgi:hypothetical protein
MDGESRAVSGASPIGTSTDSGVLGPEIDRMAGQSDRGSAPGVVLINHCWKIEKPLSPIKLDIQLRKQRCTLAVEKPSDTKLDIQVKGVGTVEDRIELRHGPGRIRLQKGRKFMNQEHESSILVSSEEEEEE